MDSTQATYRTVDGRIFEASKTGYREALEWGEEKAAEGYAVVSLVNIGKASIALTLQRRPRKAKAVAQERPADLF